MSDDEIQEMLNEGARYKAMTKREACARAAMRVDKLFSDRRAHEDLHQYRCMVDAILAELAEPDEAMMRAGKHGEGDLAKILQKQSWQAMLWAAAGGGDK